MLPLDSPASTIAFRLRDCRLELGWSREELGARAQVSPETLKAFERTGQISLPRLIRLAIALGRTEEFEQLFSPRRATTLDEVARRATRRQRGRRAP